MTVITSITSLSVSPTSSTLESDQTLQLNKTVNPSTTTEWVQWTSSNSKIVTVSDTGLVKAVCLSFATVTATNTSGNSSSTCTIKINRILITKVTYTDHENLLCRDTLNNPVTLPSGFKYVKGLSIKVGIVIADNEGNQFVWIPVSNIDEGSSWALSSSSAILSRNMGYHR